VTSEPAFDRIAVVVHPARAIENALAALRRWTDGRGIELVQLGTSHEVRRRQVATFGEVDSRDLVVAAGAMGRC
jgi:hypothetical protein